MRGSLGIVIGLIVGAGGMYLVLRPPWGGAAVTTPSDAGVVSMAPADAGSGKPKKKKKRRPPGTVATPGSPDEEEYYEETEPLPVLTDADRRLEWRGDDVSLPATKLDMGAGGEARKLDDNEINATIGSQAGGVRDCVIQGATGTDLRATITVKLVVDRAGKVSKSKLHAPRYLFDKGLLNCAQRSLRSMKFPATGAPTLVTLPISLG
ncbi:MAG: hypothetical protein H0T42_20235 [Deltaproteobacteria bacterium]|nr:hypothetical protein [Deltaproteobacteria bacterium]